MQGIVTHMYLTIVTMNMSHHRLTPLLCIPMPPHNSSEIAITVNATVLLPAEDNFFAEVTFKFNCRKLFL